jgi:hypothetical protein
VEEEARPIADEFRVLSDNEIFLVGKIILAWGSAESALGWAVSMAYGFKDAEVSRELVLKRSFGQKLELAKRVFPRAKNPDVDYRLSELAWVFQNFRSARDALAHGSESFDFFNHSGDQEASRGVMLPSHNRLIKAADLQGQLLAAKYVSEVSSSICTIFLLPKLPAEAIPPLPPRPPLLVT